MIATYDVNASSGAHTVTTDLRARCGFHPDHSGCTQQEFEDLVQSLGEGGDHVCLGGRLVPLPPKPTDAHKWSWALGGWSADVEELRRLRRSEVNSWRDAAEFSPFTWGGFVFDADQNAQRRLQLAALAAQQAIGSGVQPEPTVDWTMADNTTVTLSATQLLAAARAMGDHINVAHQAARALKAQIDAAVSVEQLMAIQIG